MKEINDNIRQAIRLAVREHGSVLRFSRELGVSHSTVLFWLQGKTRRISTDLWQKRLYFLLEPFLNIRELRVFDSETSSVMLKGLETIREIPIVSEEDLQCADPVFCPMHLYIEKVARETVGFRCNAGINYFALRVSGNALGLGDAIQGYALVSLSDVPTDGDIVITKIRRNKKPEFRKLFYRGKCVVLRTFDQTEEELTWDPEAESGVLEWMYPLRTVKFDIGNIHVRKRRKGF